MRTILLAIRFDIDMPIDEVYAFVRPIIMEQLEEKLNALKDKVGAAEIRIDISVY